MLPRRRALAIARFMLAWFALYLGVAGAAPLFLPADALQSICSASNAGQPSSDTGGDASHAGSVMHCALCAATAAPPPAPPRLDAIESLPLAYATRAIPAARLAALTAAPLPARGPPAIA